MAASDSELEAIVKEAREEKAKLATEAAIAALGEAKARAIDALSLLHYLEKQEASGKEVEESKAERISEEAAFSLSDCAVYLGQALNHLALRQHYRRDTEPPVEAADGSGEGVADTIPPEEDPEATAPDIGPEANGPEAEAAPN